MGPYSLPSVGNSGGVDTSGVNSPASTLSWLTQPLQLNSSGTLPATTIINIGNVIKISGPDDYILFSSPNGNIPELVIGQLPDGTVGMVSAKSGVSVLGLFN